MDLSKLDTLTGSEEGRWFEPVDLSGKKIGIKILVYGPDSKKYGRAQGEVKRRLYKEMASASSGLEPKAGEETEAEQEARFYAAVTGGWESTTEDPVTWGDQAFPYSEANALKLYLTVPSIKAQVKLFADHRRNFTKPARED